MPIFRDERTYSFATNVTKIKGRHEFRGGYMVNFLYLDHWQPETRQPARPVRLHRPAAPRRSTAAQADNFYNQWAAFLLGLPGTVSKSVQDEEMTGREWQHGMFVRDRWTVSSKLTLDLGCAGSTTRSCTAPIAASSASTSPRSTSSLGGRGGNPKNVGLEAGKDNFAPRMGLVYRMNEDTVFRTGYGVTYNPIPWSRPMRGFYPVTIASQLLQHQHVPALRLASIRAFRSSPVRT